MQADQGAVRQALRLVVQGADVYDIHRLSVVRDLRGMRVLHVVHDTGRAEGGLEDLGVVEEQGYVLDLVGGHGKGHVHVQGLARLDAAYADGHVHVALPLGIEPIVDVHGTGVLAVHPNGPSVVRIFSMFLGHDSSPFKTALYGCRLTLPMEGRISRPQAVTPSWKPPAYAP